MVMDEVSPELIFIVSAYPDMPKYPVLGAAARDIDGPSIVCVVGIAAREIYAAIVNQKLCIRMNSAEAMPGVDRSGPDGVLTQFRISPAAEKVEVACFGLHAKPPQE